MEIGVAATIGCISPTFASKTAMRNLHYNRYYFPPAHHTLLGRVTLVAILLAGGSGIAYDFYTRPLSQMASMNAQLDAAHDALLSRALGIKAENCVAVNEVASLHPAGASVSNE